MKTTSRLARLSAVLVILFVAPVQAGEMSFAHHTVDRWAGKELSSWGQTALADMDRDGDLDYVLARNGGVIVVYEYQAPDKWVRHQVGDKSPSDVGGAVADVDRDGRPDIILGGAWLQNPGALDQPWPRHAFDPKLTGVHDLIVVEIDGDKGLEIATMADRNNIRWYDVPENPTQPWTATAIGKPAHAGLEAGDLDGDGDNDIVRSTAWFENQENGRRWVEHRLHASPWPDVPGSYHDSTLATVADVNKDGRNDVVLTIAEVVNSQIAWFEPPADPKSGPWTMHVLPQSTEKRGPYHSLSIADFDSDGDIDIFSGEMEHIRGEGSPRWYIWENVSGKGDFVERVILDRNLGTHECISGDIDGDGDIDLIGKPWTASPKNAAGGEMHIDFLENRLK